MIYNYIKEDLFKNEEEYWLAHCISSDLKLGAGIAVEFVKRYDMRNKLIKQMHSGVNNLHPAIMVDKESKTINLITKDKYWNKPTLEDLTKTLILMKDFAIKHNIDKIAMPKIGSGLDRLKWEDVERNIKEVFANTDIEIRVSYL